MKTTCITFGILLFSMFTYSQNKNIKDETKTTVTTVKTSEGTKKYIKQENVKEVQAIELKEAKPNTLNIEKKDTPVNVTTTTKIINPDGTTRTVDVDRSSYYLYNGNKYKVTLDAAGYTMVRGNEKPFLIRKTSTNSYILRMYDKTAIGYFDTNGDLVVETYDDNLDTISVVKYTAVKE